jgi:hypothetical protein
MGGLMRRRILAVLAAGGLLFSLVPITAAATWVDFGTPTARSLARDRRLRPAGHGHRARGGRTAADDRSTRSDRPSSSWRTVDAGSTTLTHRLDPDDGHIQPNTRMVARWRLTAAGDQENVQLGPEVRVTFADERFEWKTDAGDLVRVHWYDGSAAFGRRALQIGEDAMKESSELLGVTESEPVDFYIYADQSKFLDAIGPQFTESVGGLANSSTRTMFGHIPPGQIDAAWIRIVIPRADPSRLQHRVEEPLPLPAEVAQRGARGLREPGV